MMGALGAMRAVMAGLVPAIYVVVRVISSTICGVGSTWMPGTRPDMTVWHERRSRTSGRLAATILTALLFSACSSSAPLPPYQLAAAAKPPTKRPFAVVVDPPTTAANLESDRILVKERGDALVLADARWPQPLPAMVAARVSETIASPEGPPRVRLALNILHFELIAERKTVIIAIDATALDATSGAPLRHRTFSANATVPTTRPPDVVAGFELAFVGLQAKVAAFAFDP